MKTLLILIVLMAGAMIATASDDNVTLDSLKLQLGTPPVSDERHIMWLDKDGQFWIDHTPVEKFSNPEFNLLFREFVAGNAGEREFMQKQIDYLVEKLRECQEENSCNK